MSTPSRWLPKANKGSSLLSYFSEGDDSPLRHDNHPVFAHGLACQLATLDVVEGKWANLKALDENL